MSNTCNYCSSQIEINRSRDRKKKYCSRKCAARDANNVPIEPCPVCGDQVVRTKNEHGRKKYCSRACANKSRSKTHIRECKQCGEEFELDNIAEENRGGGKFCSVSCAKRQYRVNENFFDKLTHESSYWLGFIFADGNVSKSNERTIKRSRKDENHICKFKTAIKSEHPIKQVSNKHSNLSKITITSKRLAESLEEVGCYPNKTNSLQYPPIDSSLDSDFIKGYFDGDGYVGVDGNNPEWMIYSGSKEFVTQLSEKLNSRNIPTRKTRGGNALYLSSPNSNIQKLYEFLYENNTSQLDRKHQSFLTALDVIS